MKRLDIVIEKVENGFVVLISGSDCNFNGNTSYRYVYNSWEAAIGFISSLNDKFK